MLCCVVLCKLAARYAARVKMITNDAAKASESKEIQRLKVGGCCSCSTLRQQQQFHADSFFCFVLFCFFAAALGHRCRDSKLMQDIIAKLKAGQAVELDDH